MSPELTVFLLGAVGLALVFRRYLTRPGRHEFWRLWAFVGLLGLACLSARSWFVDAARPGQLLSWIVLALSAGLAAVAGRQLRGKGHPETGIEPTTVLVTDGVYRHLRHPLYLSLLLLAAGVWLKSVSWVSTAAAAATVLAIGQTIRMEENELQAQFGEAYSEYKARVKAIIPWLV
jgi:protein-S-isoprenylcysteine O-methyltransferase Ste14